MDDRFISTTSGRIHFLHGGSGPALLLLHSNGGSAYDFETVSERLCRSFEVFAWDMPGQGDSDPLAGHMTVPQYADAAIDFMDRLGLKKASALGVSIGGAVSVALGARHASRMEHLTIVECPFRPEAEWRQQWARIEANFGQPVQAKAAVAPRLNTVTDEFMVRWNIDRCKAGAKTMMSVMWALREYDAAADLPAVPAGSTVIYGRKGPTIANMNDFVGRMKAPRVEVMADCGHFPMFDAPDEFCDLVEQRVAAGS